MGRRQAGMTKSLDGLHVLLVDDDRHLRAIVRALLSPIPGLLLHEAEDAVSGWDMFLRHKAGLIIVDWNMPKINGMQFIRRVRQSPGSPDERVPILLMTGHTNAQVIACARDAGANQILAKPISAENLYTKMTAAISDTRPFIEAKRYVGPDRRRRNAPYNGEDRRKGRS